MAICDPLTESAMSRCRNISGMVDLDGRFPEFLSNFNALTDLYMFNLPSMTGTIPSGIFHPELERL